MQCNNLSRTLITKTLNNISNGVKSSLFASSAVHQIMSHSYSVVHMKAAKQFAITINDEEEKAILQYDYIKPNLVDLHHTEVPLVFRGKGIAKLLAKAALEHFVGEKVKMQLSCTYLQKYVKDNPQPEYKDIMTS